LIPHREALELASEHFQRALPVTARKYLTPDRVTRIVLNAISRNPRLVQCSRESVLVAVMDAVQVGLEPGGPLGHAYLVPYRNGKTGQFEAQTQIGYKGYLELAWRSGHFAQPPWVQLVHESDHFVLDLGSGNPPEHRFDHKLSPEERGPVVGGYCVARFTNGGTHTEYMSIAEIEGIRDRSKAKDHGPWKTDEAQMMRKTIIRRARHYWPISTEFAQAAEVDNRADSREHVDPRMVYDADFAQLVEPEKPAAPPAGRHAMGSMGNKGSLDPDAEKESAAAKIERVQDMTMIEELEAAMLNEKRKTVMDAIRKRLAQLRASAPPATPPEQPSPEHNYGPPAWDEPPPPDDSDVPF
jgi:recombination protein RecT